MVYLGLYFLCRLKILVKSAQDTPWKDQMIIFVFCLVFFELDTKYISDIVTLTKAADIACSFLTYFVNY